MSLPVYEAISFQGMLEKGGHSKPWLVLVNMNNSPKPFVVKLYKTIDIEARNKMTAEVIGNILASAFGLNVPSPAIIDFSHLFRMQLSASCEGILSQIDERPKFGCAFIEGAYLFHPQTDRRTTKKLLDPALLYAFDYFICNRDRNLNKPNLLVHQDKTYLIDHEMGLEISSESFTNFDQRIWDSRYQNHLFYNYLKKSSAPKAQLFDEFLLYLHDFNFQRLSPFFVQLERMGFTTNKEFILEYWNTIKDNSSIFASILYSSIQ